MNIKIKNCRGQMLGERFFSFKPERAVYLEGGPDAVVAKARTDTTEAAERIEADISGKGEGAGMEMSVDSAVKLAQQKIADIARKARAEVATDKEIKEDPANIHVARIDGIRDGALAKIEGNKDKYLAMAAFVEKKVGLDAMLTTNAEAFASIKGTNDLRYIELLEGAATGLEASSKEMQGMQAPGLTAEQEALVRALRDQSQSFRAEIASIRLAYKGKIDEAYPGELVTTVEAALAGGSIPNLHDIQSLEAKLTDLRGLGQALTAYPEEGELVGLAQGRVKSVEDLMAKAQEKFTASAEMISPTYKEWRVTLASLQANLQKAQQKFDAVKGGRGSREEVVKADIWLNAAKAAYDEQAAKVASGAEKINLTFHPDAKKPAPIEGVATVTSDQNPKI